MTCALRTYTLSETTTTEDMAIGKRVSNYSTSSSLQEIKRAVTVAGHFGQPP
jgi:hypothetical protein